jgi:predicted DCC family thiol-disulfide oxidoreductase YuxK
VCTRGARWVRRRDRAGRVLVLANQKPGVLLKYGITREEALRSAWVLDHAGRRWEGAAAINRVLGELSGYPSWLAAAYSTRPIRAVEDAFYRWFAPRRRKFSFLGTRPECDEPDSGCG